MTYPAQVFAALANPDRLALVQALHDGDSEAGPRPGLSIVDLAMRTGLSRFSAFRHLAILREAHIVEANTVGNRTLHVLDP
jgi:DNA-binding transcriptional ArsR family regulator